MHLIAHKNFETKDALEDSVMLSGSVIVTANTAPPSWCFEAWVLSNLSRFKTKYHMRIDLVSMHRFASSWRYHMRIDLVHMQWVDLVHMRID